MAGQVDARPASCSLEDKFGSELHVTRSAQTDARGANCPYVVSGGYCSQTAGRDIVGVGGQISEVSEVEDFRAKLQAGTLRYREVLEDGEIDLTNWRAVELIAAFI